jgi:hypothetical protein
MALRKVIYSKLATVLLKVGDPAKEGGDLFKVVGFAIKNKYMNKNNK